MIEHISYSSIRLYNANPSAWYSKYILGINDQMSNPSALVGIGFHAYMEHRYKGVALDVAREVAQAKMRSLKDTVDYRKTGSFEKCLESLDKLIEGYTLSPIHVGKILGVEMGFLTKVPGIKLPLKGFVDLVHEVDGKLHIVDWKSVSAYDDEPTPSHLLQASFYYWALKAVMKRTPERFDVVQIKPSKNVDGSPQVKVLSVVYAERDNMLRAMKALVQMTLKEMGRKRKFHLINFDDSYEGSAELNRFIQTYA